jgi:putative ABC transport system permease protein
MKSGFLAMLGEAWRAMGANRLRTLLTMLGMVIGVGAVVLMMSVGQGAQYAIKQTITAMGSNLFVLLSGSTSAGGVRSGGGSNLTLTVGDADAIAELPGVQAVAPIHPGNAQTVYGPNNWNTSIIGTTPGYLEARSPHWSGLPTRRAPATRVALIGKTAAEICSR